MRRGIWILNEEEIARLIKLPPGQRVIGVQADWVRMSLLIGIEGDGMPEVAEGSETPIVGQGIPGFVLDTCETCSHAVRWIEHSPDAVNPIGLWHHERLDLDDDHDPRPRANMARWGA